MEDVKDINKSSATILSRRESQKQRKGKSSESRKLSKWSDTESSWTKKGLKFQRKEARVFEQIILQNFFQNLQYLSNC